MAFLNLHWLDHNLQLVPLRVLELDRLGLWPSFVKSRAAFFFVRLGLHNLSLRLRLGVMDVRCQLCERVPLETSGFVTPFNAVGFVPLLICIKTLQNERQRRWVMRHVQQMCDVVPEVPRRRVIKKIIPEVHRRSVMKQSKNEQLLNKCGLIT